MTPPAVSECVIELEKQHGKMGFSSENEHPRIWPSSAA
jgi:hypothetical protein